jgi:hypothetical protein
MSTAKISISNPSVSSGVRVMHAVVSPEGEGWSTPQPAAALSPMQTETVTLALKRRTTLETSSADDILIPIANTSLQHTLKLTSLPKKGDPSTIGFLPPARNGQVHQCAITINSKSAAAVELLPT